MSARNLQIVLVAFLAFVALGWWLGRPVRTSTGGANDNATLTFLAVGQGDCTVFRTGENTILIDAGPGGRSGDSGARIILPKLRAMGVDRIDSILLSHPDLDHVGGVKSILRAYPMAHLVFPAAFRHHDDVIKDEFIWHLKPEEITWLGPKSTMTVGSYTLEIACPPLSPGGNDNDGSMLIHLTGNGASATFTGDAPSAVEDWALQNGFDPSSDVLHCGHHGSRFSTGFAWLRAAHPTFGVLSCGRNNRYGHPHPDVLARLKAMDVQPLRTDTGKDFHFVVRGGHFVPD